MSRVMGLASGPVDRWLVHDLRQTVATGILLAEVPGGGECGGELGRRLLTVRQLLESMMAMLAPSSVSSASEDSLVDIAAVVRECVEGVAAGRVGAPVVVLPLAEVHGYGDGVLLRRAIRNALDNASRAVGDEGEVRIGLTTRCSQAVIEVLDDGAGFGEIPSGSGQGLSMISHAMRAWHGSLEIVSGPGRGTTVRMVVPCDGLGRRS